MVNSTIPISKEINSFDELIKILKLHTSFTIFKNSCKQKLQVMEYNYKQDIATFLANFHSLCIDAEISNPEEIRVLLINSFIDDDVVFEESKIIKYDIEDDEISNNPNLHSNDQDELEIPEDGF
ncbi:hypothetical protein C1645_831576 [Glomus cerebriforme]|uniref:Uncharacterized protein n=1 Tax=Glomus cerebriforme TaxID=658196 RepID=A0A397SQH8_9GLOM|nr:hypothetical protein C1645_831576 [Glomus cerebriforme]